MAPDPTVTVPPDEDDEAGYVSADDEDFAPSDGENRMSVDSDSDADDAKEKKERGTGAKAAASAVNRDDVGEIERDEVEGLMKDAGKKRRGGKKADAEDSGGEGGFVKTRRMAAAAQEERQRKPLASGKGATIDVDALWQRMNAGPLAPERAELTPHTSPVKGAAAPAAEGDMVEVTETYRFAGELHKRTRLVPRGSAAAADAENAAPAASVKTTPTGKPQIRPLRRASAFDPNPAGAVRNLPPKPGEAPTKAAVPGGSKNKNKGPRHAYAIPAVRSVKRLNVVDKSKLDWDSHVDQTGQRDELEAARKQKGNFLERRDFLERVEDREEGRRLEAKAKG